MIKIENIEVMGFKPAIRGMRNPMNSWNKSDSWFESEYNDDYGETTQVNILGETQVVDGCSDDIIGENDYNLMLNLAEAGGPHAKYRRMITVYMDITAPLYWWKEFDTYKVGTVANSCSTMHKIHAKEFDISDFSVEHLITDKDTTTLTWGDPVPMSVMETVIYTLNAYRQKYLTTLKTEEHTGLPAKDIWWQMIQLLPSSYNQKRTVMLNYEVLAHMYHDRKGHKLDEWREFCQTMCAELPEPELFIVEE